MNNLALLEHKLCDRMDDVVKAMTRTMADKFDTAKKFRIMENQLKSLFELTLVALRDTDENFEIKQQLNNITKSSKKLQTPNGLMLHLKAQMAGHVFGGGNDIYMTADENIKKGKNSYRAVSAGSSRKNADHGQYILSDTP